MNLALHLHLDAQRPLLLEVQVSDQLDNEEAEERPKTLPCPTAAPPTTTVTYNSEQHNATKTRTTQTPCRARARTKLMTNHTPGLDFTTASTNPSIHDASTTVHVPSKRSNTSKARLPHSRTCLREDGGQIEKSGKERQR